MIFLKVGVVSKISANLRIAIFMLLNTPDPNEIRIDLHLYRAVIETGGRGGAVAPLDFLKVLKAGLE